MDLLRFTQQFAEVAERRHYDVIIYPGFGLHYLWTERSEFLEGTMIDDPFPLKLSIDMPSVWPGYQASFLLEWQGNDAEEGQMEAVWDRFAQLRTELGFVKLSSLQELKSIEDALLDELRRDQHRLSPPLQNLANVLKVLLDEILRKNPELSNSIYDSLTSVWSDATTGLPQPYLAPGNLFTSDPYAVIMALSRLQASGVAVYLTERDRILTHAHRIDLLLRSCRVHIEAATTGDKIDRSDALTLSIQFPDFFEFVLERTRDIRQSKEGRNKSRMAEALLDEWGLKLAKEGLLANDSSTPSHRTVLRYIDLAERHQGG